MRKPVRLLALLLLFSCLLSTSAAADVGYKTLTTLYDRYYFETRTAYTPVGMLRAFGEETFQSPSDMVVQDGILYICDTKNARVLVGTAQGEWLRTIGEGRLETPTGLCLTADGHVLVADKTAQAVFEFDGQGALIQTFTRPDEPLYGNEATFVPIKVGIDASDNLYILSDANTNGLVQMSRKTGEFIAYFGANDTPVTLWTVVSSILYTDEQKSRTSRNLPPSSVNLAVDDQGLVYTITDAKTTSAYRKLNFAGENMLTEPFAFSDLADITLTGICTGDIRNVYLCSKDGYILEFDQEGQLLFAFGGLDDGSQRNGLFGSTAAVSYDNGQLYVLDDSKNEIQIFRPTVFASTVHKGIDLYQQGKYLQSEDCWRAVTQMDSMFTYANKGMGAVYYKQGNYAESLSRYRLANDRRGYSRAFSELRNHWIRENILWIISALVGLGLLAAIYHALRKRVPVLARLHGAAQAISRKPFLAQIRFLGYMPRNPADACYGIKHEQKVSMLSATVLYGVFFVWYVLDKYFKGFLFSSTAAGRFDILTDIGLVCGAFILVNACLYLICSITEGEARFRDIYCGIIYSMMPYLVLKPLIVLSSHICTRNESFLIYLLETLAIAGCVILFVVMVREMNNYTYAETFKVLFLTVFALLIAVAALFVLYILYKQFADFLYQLFKEVRYRVRT